MIQRKIYKVVGKVISSMKNRVFLVLALCLGLSVIGTSISPSTAYACSCIEPGAVEVELERSDAVFTGKAIEIKEQKQLGGGTINKILFELIATWKGESKSQIVITTGQGHGDCGYDFRQGEEYLVYAHRSSMYGYNNTGLTTIVCDRTNELSEAEDDLVELGEGKAPTEEGNLVNKFYGTRTLLWMIAIVVIGFVSFLVRRRFRN
ncbi:hypothetical protein ACOI1C_18275 [Bacillus sp. DJP31]|uniref:hypothetical protein n=1 Tax=Bacillus sp. DJP31 TaxID=3409789 RepID=UPI003BB7ABB8